jgi:hypothetical protein
METDRKKDMDQKLLDAQQQSDIEAGEPRPSTLTRCCAKLDNKTVLLIVCIIFACFATSELIGGLVSSLYC